MLMISTLHREARRQPGPPGWFATRSLGDSIHVIAEPGHVNSFLVLGEDRALLFDSGMGIGSIAAEVRAITSLPLIVVNSHHHYDHRGGNGELAALGVQLAVHESGVDLHGEADLGWLEAYGRVARRLVDDFARYSELDSRTFFLLDDALRVRPLPELNTWRIPAVRPDRALGDGETLDLGGRSWRVLHTPGHSPDGICLWEEATRTLLTGDTVLAAAYWSHFPEADIAVSARSLRALAGLGARRVLVAHNLRCELPGSAVQRAADAFARVRDGASRGQRSRDPFGNPVCRHDFDGFAVLAPPPENTTASAEVSGPAAIPEEQPA